MKKVTFLMALAVAAGMASCTAQSPKADLKTDIDSLSYAIGMARTEGLDQYLAQQGIDSTQMSEFLKGFNEGAAKIDKKDVAYMAGLQVGQMVSKQWVEGFNQQIFGNDSTQSISRENLLAGFVAGVIGKGGAMDMMKAQEYMRTQMDAIKEKRQDANYQKAFEQLDYADNQHMVSQPNNGDIANLITAMMEATLYDFEDVTEQMNTMNEEAKATLTDLQ